MTIKNIIFDLGGVIIDINYHLTLEAFKKLGATNIEAVYNQAKQTSIFDDFETGKITETEFRIKLKNDMDIKVNDEIFDNAWNAMLLDLPYERLEFIKSLNQDYRIFLFSNTNIIHLKKVFEICEKQNGFNHFDDFFEKQYYSHIFKSRKPNADAFIKILNENEINADETLFIDDSIQHVLGAKEAGLHAIHLTNDQSIFNTIQFIQEIESQNQAIHSQHTTHFSLN